MKKFVSLTVAISLFVSLAGCGFGSNKDVLTPATTPDSEKVETLNTQELSGFNLAEAQNSSKNDPFETVEPMYNVPNDKVFKIKLNLDKDATDFIRIQDYFGVYTDRDCNEKSQLMADIGYDVKTNEITIKPDKTSWAMYPRDKVDTGNGRNWGSLQTYYILTKLDVSANKVLKLEKPKRMTFTVASTLDIPTVTAKQNTDGNVTLYWKAIPDATEYKIYSGSKFKMVELGRTKDTNFVLTEDKYKESSMNTLVSFTKDYAVVAVKGSDESRLSNVIHGDDIDNGAPNSIESYEKTSFNANNIDSLTELPTSIDIRLQEYSSELKKTVVKAYPISWDFRNLIEDKSGTITVKYYKGAVKGTTFNLRYLPFDSIPTEKEIAEYEKNNPGANAIAVDVKDAINIPNAPSNKDTSGDKNSTAAESDITATVQQPKQEANTPKPESGKSIPKNNLELAIAEGMINHQESIDLSKYTQASDSAYLKDVLQKVLVQYPLIVDEKDIGFDFSKKTLKVSYSLSKADAAKKQKEVQDKVKSVVASVVKSGMSVEEKEKALHDWIIENGKYQDEVLKAYMDGEDLSKISAKYADAFSVYGILVKGLGVCQSYAETFKLLCDASEVPCVVVTGNLGSVPHAWNKVKLDNTWYHVDVTNNDGDGAIPYAVFNASDKMTASDYVVNKEYVLDADLKSYESNKDDKDYYIKNGKFASSEQQLKDMVQKELSSQKDFYIKVDPTISEDKITSSLKDGLKGNEKQAKNLLYGKMFNVLGVKYKK